VQAAADARGLRPSLAEKPGLRRSPATSPAVTKPTATVRRLACSGRITQRPLIGHDRVAGQVPEAMQVAKM